MGGGPDRRLSCPEQNGKGPSNGPIEIKPEKRMTIGNASLGERSLSDQGRSPNDEMPPPKRRVIAKSDRQTAPELR